LCIARQKEKANSSVNELVEAVNRRPRSLSESANRLPFIKVPTKTVHSDHATQELQKTPSKSSRRRKSESTLPSFRRKSHSGGGDTHFNSMHPITETPENKINSRRRSFMGYIYVHFYLQLIVFLV